MRKILVVAGAVFAVSLIAVATAFAFAIKKTTVPAPSGTTTTATATCPSGSQVAQGGFKSTVGHPQGTLITALGLLGPGKWAARADDYGDPGSLTSIAYCGPIAELTRVVKSGTVTGGTTGTVTATCPKGSNVRNGGFSGGNAGDQFTVVSERRLSARKWSVSGFNGLTGPGSTAPLKAIAYCGHGPKLTTFSASASVATTGGAPAVAVAKCGSGKVLAMGGFSHTTPTDAYINKLVRPGKRSWAAGIYAFIPATVKAFAYCA